MLSMIHVRVLCSTTETMILSLKSVTLVSFTNSSPVPSVLDGGSVLVLANFHLEHSPTCHPQLLQNLPNRDYTARGPLQLHPPVQLSVFTPRPWRVHQ